MNYVLKLLRWDKDRRMKLINLHEEGRSLGGFSVAYADLKIPQHQREIEELDRAIEAVECLDYPSPTNL